MESDTRCLDTAPSQAAVLAADLKALVNRLEAHCRTASPVSSELANDLHRLCERAEQLFTDF